MVGPLRKADLKAAKRPDYFVTISEYAKEQIEKYYGRESVVIHPPVEIDDFKIKNGKSQIKEGNKEKISSMDDNELDLSDTYITTSRQVNWKRLDLAVRACLMTQRKLLMVGEGPEHKKLKKMAEGSKLVKFFPLAKKEKLAEYLSKAKGYLFPSLEPFGIAPVEALASGCPVIAYGEGGARDYVVNKENGLLFNKQTAKSLAEAILEFEKMKFDRKKISKTADKFGVDRFDKELKGFIKEKIGEKNGKNRKGI